jgi:N-acetylmuramoyl-L-alanine amidase
MKAYLLIFFVFVISSAYTQERKSEKTTQHIDFNKSDARKAWIKETVNAEANNYRAQNERIPVIMQLAAQKLSLKNVTPFLSYFLTWEETSNDEQNSLVRIRFSADDQNWGEWETMKPDEHVNETPGRFISQLQFKEKQFNYYQVEIVTNRSAKGKLLSNLYLNFFSPGDMPQTGGRISNPSSTANRPTACTLPQPSFINRAGWGITQIWNPSTTVVTHLIVHHSTGTNVSSNWGAVVLSIWNYHTSPPPGPAFTDIGYNWLVAPDGVVYEGRYNSSTSNITGAHFCGTNGNTMGVCMLGDYTSTTITAAARNSLAQVLAWKACERNIDPLASSFHPGSNKSIFNISGHRDGICPTQCPGNTFYPDLPSVRIDVSNIMNGATPVTTINGLEEFSINPNPVKNTAVLNLKLNTVKEIQYRIVSVDGKIMYQSVKQKLSGVWREELKALNELPAATYLLQLWVNDEMVSRQVVKQ